MFRNVCWHKEQGTILQEDFKGRYGFILVLLVLEMILMVINNSKNRDGLGAASTFYLFFQFVFECWVYWPYV